MPSFPKVSHSGFGYPLCDVSPSSPWEPISVPNAPELRPSKLCSPPMVDPFFRIDLSVLALFRKTSSALRRRFNGLLPPEELYLSCNPEGLARVKASALLGFSTSRVFSTSCLCRNHLPHDISLSFLAEGFLSKTIPMNLRALSSSGFGFFPCGTPTRLAFFTICIRHLLRR